MEIIGDWILDSISESKKLGIFTSSVVVAIIVFDHFIPAIIPPTSVNVLYSWMMINTIGAFKLQMESRKHPTVTERVCPICKNNLIYANLMCPSKGCNFSTEIPKDKITT
ncbi:hypothetical protein V7O66_02085 [Methanolobus sp. ZRKC3]|uniref:hypothetical protein n=1 Tax=Methanolobus sp. ZRKC3 TaxID=3125786 RepID=UPI00324B0D7B